MQIDHIEKIMVASAWETISSNVGNPEPPSCLHFSHFKLKSSKQKLPDIQKIPGHCVLCPKQFYTNLENMMWKYYQRVHIKCELRCLNRQILFCKCCEIPNRGTDKSTHNSHYHCLMCHKPCDTRWTLGIHLVSKHSFSDNDVSSLY